MNKVMPKLSRLIPVVSKLVTSTSYSLPDEKAWAYLEVEEQASDYSGFHRYRVIYLNRDGNDAEYCEDMGKAENFIGAKKTIHIPSLWEHTVAELKDLADSLRYEHKIDIRELAETDNIKLA